MKSSKVFGIDLGTTYSCVSYVGETGKPEIVPNDNFERTTPSVVWFDGSRVVVGAEAKESTKTEPNNVCSFIKRSMGDETFYAEYGGTRYSPEEISSFILRKLVKDAEQTLGEEIRDVVITCPAYFFVKERNATKRAGELAGLNVLQIVNEPTAAAIAYGINGDERDKTVLVYDLGGGTFDVTSIRFSRDSVDVLCTDGDHRLGGKDWDDRLVRLLVERFQDETGSDFDFYASQETLAELFVVAEKIKKQLSVRDKTSERVSVEDDSARIEITRAEFEAATSDLLNRTLDFTRNAIALTREKGAFIDEIVLVGGSSKMPAIAASVEREFGITPQLFDPDEAVAKGAAIIGSNLALQKMLEEKARSRSRGRSTELTLDDMEAVASETGYTLETVKKATRQVRNVASKSFGVLCVWDGDEHEAYLRKIYDANLEFVWNAPDNGQRVTNLLYKNTPLKAIVSDTFYTMIPDQKSVAVEICENLADENEAYDGVSTAESTLLATKDLPLPPGLPAGAPIKIIFEMTPEGLLTATATEQSSRRGVTITIETGSSALSPEEKRRQEKRCSELTVE